MDKFYALAFEKALERASSQFYQQLHSERTWEQARKPYYHVWPSIVPMLTRLNLDLDSALIQLPLPALCIRLPKQHNPLSFQWQDQRFEIRSILLSDPVPFFTYRYFHRRKGPTVDQSLEASRETRHVDKARRHSEICRNVRRRIEVAPHRRRPHMALVRNG